jgi:hypothetical protein
MGTVAVNKQFTLYSKLFINTLASVKAKGKMSAVPQENQVPAQEATKQNDKEFNFAQIRQQLEREKQEKVQLREEVEKLKKLAQDRVSPPDDDTDDSDEPYVDHRRLKKELGKVVKQTYADTDTRIDAAVSRALSEERQRQWLKNNPDFHEVMKHAQAFADKDPELAESILEMPEGFERQKLVYKNIKALGVHKKEEPKPSIQEQIDKNRRSPYYQPSGVAAAPFVTSGNFSPSGQKDAYQKMKELQARLRI